MFSPGSQVPRAHDDKADGQEQKASRQVAVASGSTDPNIERREKRVNKLNCTGSPGVPSHSLEMVG
jgi:hypothetical protein